MTIKETKKIPEPPKVEEPKFQYPQMEIGELRITPVVENGTVTYYLPMRPMNLADAVFSGQPRDFIFPIPIQFRVR